MYLFVELILNSIIFALKIVEKISRFYGIIIYMFYNEHNPPHFHIEYQDFAAIIEIETGIIRGKMPRRALKLVFEWMDLHKEELLLNWKKNRRKRNIIKNRTFKLKIMDIIKVKSANYLKDYVIRFEFDDGLKKEINFEKELWGTVFEPLKDIEKFKNFKLNSWTIEWENGTDFAPEFLYKFKN